MEVKRGSRLLTVGHLLSCDNALCRLLEGTDVRLITDEVCGRSSVYLLSEKGLVKVVADSMDNCCVITDLTVLKDSRGCGEGTRLLGFGVEVARALGVGFVEVSVPKGSWLEEWFLKSGFDYFRFDRMSGKQLMLMKLV